MATINSDPSMTTTSGLSLEDELAEATQDLLDLGQQEPLDLRRGRVSPLPTPSPFLLSRPASRLTAAASAPSKRLVVDVDKALAIDPNARLTPIQGDGSAIRSHAKPNIAISSNVNADQSASIGDEDVHLPSARLHQTVQSVTFSSAHGWPGHQEGEPSKAAIARSPALQAAYDSLRGDFWARKSTGGSPKKVAIDSKSKSMMDRLQVRLDRSKSLGKTDGSDSGNDRTPEFFRESFPGVDPDAKSEEQASEDTPVTPRTGSNQTRPNLAASSSANRLPPSLSSRPSVAAAATTDASITVKLHGNRRAEREAALQVQDDLGNEVDQLSSLAAHDDAATISSLPIADEDESLAYADDDDANSLTSLSATTATNSSLTSSTRRRSNSSRRRRSHGSTHSLLTTDSIGADSSSVPFTRAVQIRSFSVVGEKARGYVSYDVRITTQTGTTISILRRFSSFVALRKALTLECGQRQKSSAQQATRTAAKAELPALPPRRTGLLQKYAADHLEKRRRALQKWLTIIMLDDVWGTSRALRQWVVGSDDVDDER